MTRLLVLARNLQQASYRVRVEALYPHFRAAGIEPFIGLRTNNPIASYRLMRSAAAYDAVLLQRKFLEPWEAAVLRKSARRILYDIDDALMYHNRPVGLISRWRTGRRFRATAAAVDLVVAGNEYLADHFRALGCRATVLPTVVDPARYVIKQHAETPAPRLVWIGSHSTRPYLRTYLPLLQKAAEAVSGLGLITIADQTIHDAGIPVEHRPWSAETEAASLTAGDIGIAPTPTDPWTLGKCGFKIVQYMAAGLPVVASPVGANAELVRPGETGFLPQSESEWVESIVRLARDVTLRQNLGTAGRQRVEADLNIRAVAERWIEIIRSGT